MIITVLTIMFFMGANQDRRLDKHSDRLDALEKTQHQALTLKSLLVWMTATILTAIGIVVAVAQVIMK